MSYRHADIKHLFIFIWGDDQCVAQKVETPLFNPAAFPGHVTIKIQYSQHLRCKKQMHVVNHVDFKTHPPIPLSAFQRS